MPTSALALSMVPVALRWSPDSLSARTLPCAQLPPSMTPMTSPRGWPRCPGPGRTVDPGMCVCIICLAAWGMIQMRHGFPWWQASESQATCRSCCGVCRLLLSDTQPTYSHPPWRSWDRLSPGRLPGMLRSMRSAAGQALASLQPGTPGRIYVYIFFLHSLDPSDPVPDDTRGSQRQRQRRNGRSGGRIAKIPHWVVTQPFQLEWKDKNTFFWGRGLGTEPKRVQCNFKGIWT